MGALCVFDVRSHLDDLGLIERTLTALARRVDLKTNLRRAAVPDRLADLRDTDVDKVRAVVSHEIRTPLAVIRGYLEILSDTPGALDPAFQPQVDAINRNADRLCLTVDHLLRPSA